jgi:hypothetical protein
MHHSMKKILLATSLLVIGASAHAETYYVDGVTIHVHNGCRSTSCVSVYAPDYGYYHEGRAVKVRRAQKEKDMSRVASVTKKQDAAPAASAPVVEAKPTAAPAATPETATPAKSSDNAASK